MYAVIEDSGTQIRVSPGDVIQVDLRHHPDDAEQLTFDRVLMVGDGEGATGEGERTGGATVGTPYVEGATVTADLLGEVQGEKLTVFKFKRRKGYRRKHGHRQRYLKVKISDINS